MKKILYIAAIFALFSLNSCSKQEPEQVRFTAAIDNNATKLSIEKSGTKWGIVKWDMDDEISLYDSEKTINCKIVSIDETTGTATFVPKESGISVGSGPYTATYGYEPNATQYYNGKPCPYMTASSSTKHFKFTVMCGVLGLNLQSDSGELVHQIQITDDDENTYVLVCTEDQSIATTKTFYISLPEGNFTKIIVRTASNKKVVKNATIPLETAINTYSNLTFTGLTFK